MNQPFKDEDVLYRFVYPKIDGREYVLLQEDEERALYLLEDNGQWVQSSHIHRLVNNLLADLTAACAEMETWKAESQRWFAEAAQIARNMTEPIRERDELLQKESALTPAIADLKATLDKVEAERDAYRATLEQYANEHNWSLDANGHFLDSWRGPGNGYEPARAVLAQYEKKRRLRWTS